MRISDWSSDVCSSDLSSPYFEHRLPEALAEAAARLGPRYDDIVVDEAQDFREWGWPALLSRSEGRRVGKEVEVRVDLGGRRIITKTNNIDIRYTIENCNQIHTTRMYITSINKK